ncbi:MAG: EAL domain-containing protein [Methyloprofundus sp.]|nr:EAL domain-containing protein [Methyloprofundus sp.]
MTQDIVQLGSQHVSDVQDINKRLTEKTLRMRCLAYMHQVKSNLLVETIHDMNSSKKQLADLTIELEEQKSIITQQNKILKKRNTVLEHDRDLLELKMEERVEAYDRLAHYDSLTDLPNRFLFKDRLKHALAGVNRQAGKIALLLLDLDRFKNINESAGHPVGDEILCLVAQRLLKNIAKGDTIARLGGDEFAIIIENFEGYELIHAVAKKIQNDLLPPYIIGDQKFYLTASMGISFSPDDSKDADSLLKHADAAMYEAKSAGKNQYQFYTASLTTAVHSRFSLETELRQALENDEFEVFYQPQFDINDKVLSGAEALVRWNHPEKGLVSPAEFIWLAEETGLILEIGNVVLKKACCQMLEWVNEKGFEGRVSVNLSAIQFKQVDIVETVKSILTEAQLDAKYLEIEITESALIGQLDQVVSNIGAFKSMGITLAIDDFGTGYSSLAYLKRFHVNKLKIDQSFVRDIPGDINDAAIVRAIIDMGHALSLSVIAEGVETQAQSEFLKKEGSDSVQGFLYGRPVAVKEFERYF